LSYYSCGYFEVLILQLSSKTITPINQYFQALKTKKAVKITIQRISSAKEHNLILSELL
jgi:hypothetical protein